MSPLGTPFGWLINTTPTIQTTIAAWIGISIAGCAQKTGLAICTLRLWWGSTPGGVGSPLHIIVMGNPLISR